MDNLQIIPCFPGKEGSRMMPLSEPTETDYHVLRLVSDNIQQVLKPQTTSPTTPWQTSKDLIFIRIICCFSCLVVKSCLTLCDPTDSSLPVHGVFQARIREWVAISYAGRSSQPRDWTYVSCIFCTGRGILYHCAAGKPSLLTRGKNSTFYGNIRLLWPYPIIKFSIHG